MWGTWVCSKYGKDIGLAEYFQYVVFAAVDWKIQLWQYERVKIRAIRKCNIM